MRDAYLAHSLVVETERPLWRELFRLTEATSALVGGLARLHGSYLNGFDGARRIQRDRSLRFWDTLDRRGYCVSIRRRTAVDSEPPLSRLADRHVMP